ncbi:MAG: alpha/beta hydrolase [Flavobacteriales bacterium]|nr:alpha/beta hydrolase [Flavobacteriales bacterium]
MKQIGTLDQKTKKVLLVCHGYGQLVEYFGKWLEVIAHKDICILCPEALHRFYLKGFGGRVGASWMTKEKRETDIKENHEFLNKILQEIEIKTQGIELHLLGFSQGAQTISRWVAQERIQASSLTLWGGRQAEDISWKTYEKLTKNSAINLWFGDQDEFYPDQKVANWLEELKEHRFAYQFHKYEGVHKLEPKALAEYAKQIMNL